MSRNCAVALLFGVWLLPSLANAQATETVRYYHTDAIGSVRAVTDENGQTIARYDFLPFGEEFPTTPDNHVPLQFAGKERDYGTEFDYFGARYHASGSGRFTTVDPVLDFKEALVDPQRWNRYTYVRNNPLAFVDPDGRAIEVALDVVLIANDIRMIAQQGFTAGNNISLAGDVVGALVPFATGLGPGARAGYELAMSGRLLEQAAQWATGLGRNTERILEGAARGANFRIPDLLSDAAQFVGEVKNASRLHLSKQLGDLIEYAQETNKHLGLFINEKTRLSKPLLEQLRQGNARIYRFVDRKWKDVTDELYGVLPPQ